MYKAEEFANLARNEKLTWWERIFYFFLLRRLRKAAKHGYGGKFVYFTINPKIKNMLVEKDKFLVKENQEDEDGDKYTLVRWCVDKDKTEDINITDDSDTDDDDTTID